MKFDSIPETPGGFSVIYADPPWRYGNSGTRAAAAKQYATLKVDDIADLPVREIVAPDAVLFLWVTWPLIEEAAVVARAWGFPDYKTAAFVWVKANRKSNSAFFGMGNWTRANTEPCLLFTRGKPKRADAGVAQFVWARILRHSEKPECVRKRIDRLMGNVPRLEMFSRHKAPGWHRWGNELLPS